MATLLLSGFFSFISCSSPRTEKEYIAKVYNQKLYEEDIPEETSENIEERERFIQNWVEENILYYNAKLDSRIDRLQINNQVSEFEKELYYFYLEKLLIQDQLDTTISENEIQTYYNTHKEEFLLKDYLVKVMYLKVPLDAPDINKIKRSYLLKKPKDIEDIIQYAKIYSSNFYYDDENWVYFDAILKEVPIKDISKEHFITQKKKLYFDDGKDYYFLNVLEFKLKDAISPLNFEKENIRKKIMNLRIKKLRDQIKNDIITKGYKKGNVEIK